MKERADLSTWDNERFKVEYELIKQKKSSLPFSQRQLIVKLMEEK